MQRKASSKKRPKTENFVIPSPIFSKPKNSKQNYSVLDWINARAKVIRKYVKDMSQQEAIKYASART